MPCAVITIRKLEADERRPSHQVAERLADALELGDPAADRFLAASRTSFAPSVPVDGDPDPSRATVPAATSSLVGRHRELDDAFARLGPAGGGARLLTIAGPPGVGKTRLAVALANRIEDKLELPVAWVELAGVAEPSGLAAAIARAVTPPGLQGAPLEDLAIRVLGRGPMVLVLDNCEHLLPAIDHVSGLLEACPDLVCVATSRSRLDLHGEHELVLEPLPLVDPDSAAPGAAIELFVDRAGQVARVRPDRDDPLVRSIVERVGGIPLGIELAALRLRDRDLAGLDASLASGLDRLGPNRRGVPARHASLTAAVAWSEALLGPTELAVLEALVVFPSGAEVEAVASVAELAPLEVRPALDSLIDAALVFRPAPASTTGARYVPFVVVREHVRARLDAGRLAAARRRHASVVLEIARARLPGITAWPEPHHLAALDDLDDDLQAALAWSFGPDGRVDDGVALAVPAVCAWFFRGRSAECQTWIDASLTARPDSYQMHYLAAVLAWEAGGTGALEMMAGALEGAEAAGDVVWVAECAGMAQTLALSQGDPALALELGPRAIAAAERVGGEWEALVHLRNGRLALRFRDLDTARSHSHRCTECYRSLGSTWGQGMASILAGAIAEHDGRSADAAGAYLQAVELFSVLGFPVYIAAAIGDCGHLLVDHGEPEAAAVLYGMVEAWLDELGLQPEPASRHRWNSGRQSARTGLGDAYEAAARRGAAMIRDLESVRTVLAGAGITATRPSRGASDGSPSDRSGGVAFESTRPAE